ncbi:MAG: CoA ester lyase [Pseudomonadales bacterium]|nr:CoA ester lyase [Pseudomonadales bacterium]
MSIENLQLKPRRSVLYMPCSNTRALDKAQTLDCDAVIFDLEDAVAPEAKDQGRDNIVTYLQEKDFGHRERVVRINHVDSEWGLADLKALVDVEFDAICLPKVECTEELNKALAVLGKTVDIWVMIETPKGVLNVEAIAAHEQVSVVVMGTNDLAKEMRVLQSESREEFQFAFGRCVMAARAYGADVLDGVYNQLDNAEGFAAVCVQGKRLGFDGKTLIHPKQLEAANKAFAPSAIEVDEAKGIIEAWQDAAEKGVLVLNGSLVEELHVIAAQRLVAMDQAINAR